MNGTDLNSEVAISQWTRDDLEWWEVALQINNGSKIPDPDTIYRPKAVRIFIDAAGGSLDFTGRGI